MRSIRCMFGIHTGLFDSHYKYENHYKSKSYNTIVARFSKKCSRCEKYIGEQEFAFWINSTEEDAIERAKKFTWNGV